MLVAGDEFGRTQQGNNNAYCQDNDLTWYDWQLDPSQEDLLAFTRRIIAFRNAHPVFRRATFFAGDSGQHALPDVYWFRPDGRRMTRRDWDSTAGKIGVFLNGKAMPDRTGNGDPVEDDSFLVVFNAHHEDTTFVLPPRKFARAWTVDLSTTDDSPSEGSTWEARAEIPSPSRSLIVLRAT
jgi:glycogen operon protein